MLRILPAVLLAPLLLAYAVAENVWSDRWQLSADGRAASQRLASLPQTIGAWQGEDKTLDPREVRQAELRGYLKRQYVQPKTGEALTVLVVFGHAGPVAAHSPTVCFGGAGFTAAGPRRRYQLEADGSSKPAEFWTERYHRAEAAIPEQFQVYYAWNPGNSWQAAEQPRLSFPWARRLYKLYVVRTLTRIDEPSESDPIPAFLKLFVPELNRCISR